MITAREIGSLLLALIVLAFSNSFIDTSIFFKSLIFFAVILAFNVTAKKLTAYYLESEEETKIWAFQRYGFYERSYFRKPIPIGIILPFLLSVLSFGMIKWFAVTESEVKPTEARAARRHQLYSFKEMTDFHVGLISASGIFSCFILAIISYLLNLPELTKLSIYFASFNLLPIGKLDGTRIFFGHRVLYAALVAIALIGLFYAFLLV
jgi:membrane-associated protease RseP (regulator of RpoE activity)